MRASVNGTSLFYETIGHGRPLMLMHGGFGFDHTYFRPWIDPLGDSAQIILYDHRAMGQSVSPISPKAVSLASLVADADALRTHLGHERVVLLGHSFGGFVALEYALTHGDRLAGLILCSTTPAWDYAETVVENAQQRGTAEQMQTLLKAFSAPIPNDVAFREIATTLDSLYFHGQPQPVLEGVRFSAAAFNEAQAAIVSAFNRIDRLSELKVPTLVVSGGDDFLMPVPKAAERLARGLPRSRLVILEQSGHYPFAEEPDRFLSEVRSWLQTLVWNAH